MNEELEKLKRQVRSIDEKVGETEEPKIEANRADKTVSVRVEETAEENTRKTRSLDDLTGEDEDSFKLDFGKISLSDDDVRQIIESATDAADETTENVRPTRDILGLDTSPVPKVVLTRTDTAEGEMWQIVQRCEYTTDSGFKITVPEGYITDLASIPRVFWAILASFELSLVAPLFHDLIYRCAGELPNDQIDPEHVFERDETDRLFLELMEKSGISWWKRRAAYRAVRTFAAFAWKKKD